MRRQPVRPFPSITPLRGLRGFALAVGLLAFGCDGEPSDVDAGTLPDAGAMDAGATDAGATDAGTTDGGAADGGPADGGPVPSDAAPDASATTDGGPCTAFTDVGCPDGAWCEPAEDLASASCTAAGSGARGDACEMTTECAEGLICAGETCEVACDPDAGGGSPGDACDGTDACGALIGTGAGGEPVLLDLGVCVPSCDFDAETPCSDASLTCVPEELVSPDFDTCLPDITELAPGADCIDAGLSRLQLCGASSICLSRADLPPGVLCYPVCRATEGTLDTFGHPDCPGSGDFCQTFATGLGVCVAAD